MLKRILLVLMVGAITLSSFGQKLRSFPAVGTWAYHLPLNKGKEVLATENLVYGSANAGFFSFEKESYTVEELTKQDGLNNVQINTMNYYKPLDMLVLAYSNSNIDILQGNAIININDIFRKQIIGDKSINKIVFHDDKAYIACSFGVVVLDLVKLEIKESYQSLGPEGEVRKVYDLYIDEATDKIYLATEEGVLHAKLAPGVNLLDFNNWNRFDTSSDSLRSLECTMIEGFGESIYCYFADTLNVLYTLKNDTVWTRDDRFQEKITNIFNFNNEELIFGYSSGFYSLDASNNVTERELTLRYLNQVIKDPVDDVYWGSDRVSGVVKITESGFEIITPVTPNNSAVFSVQTIGDRLYALRGGHDGSYTQFNQRMQVDRMGTYGWSNVSYAHLNDSPLQKVKDVQVAVHNPNNGKVFYGSHGYGLIEEYEPGQFKLYNDTNSPLINILDAGPFVRILDLDLDRQGTLWVANYIESKGATLAPIHSLDGDGNWNSYVLPNIKGVGYPTKVLADNSGNIWLTLRVKNGGGMVVFKPEEGQVSDMRHLTTEFEKGQLPDKDVRCMVEDHDGFIWFGTINGLGVFYNPELMFEDGFDTDSRSTIVDGRPVLEEEVVNCIAVDPGNRKWVGTPNGVWLFNESVSEVIYNFTEENSPLPSNNIVDIEVWEKTGEVFIATDLGLVSFRADATTGYIQCEDEVLVYPNPVEPDYTGDVAVSGLRNNARIKILDMAGNLAYETQANGGGFVWDTKNYSGQRVASGIYQIIAYGGSRKNSCVTRVAIMD